MRSRDVDVSVVTAGHDVADARLHREVAALLAIGLRVEVLGLGRAQDGPEGAAVRTWTRGGLLRRARAAAVLPWRAHGAVLLVPDPDVAVTSVPTRLLGRRRVVVDVHEDYAALLRDRPWAHGPVALLARILVRLATFAAARADLTVVADEHVPPARARRRLVQTNVPDLSVLPAPAARDPQPRAVYIGDVRRSRGLFEMLDAIEAAPGWTLDVVGPVAPQDAAALSARLTGSLASRVRLHGRMPPTRSWQLARGAWVGFALLADTPAFRDAVPSKVYEFLACGVPVVATDLPRVRDLLDASGAGVLVPARDAGRGAAQVLRCWTLPNQEPNQEYDEIRQRASSAAHEQRTDNAYAGFAVAVASLVRR